MRNFNPEEEEYLKLIVKERIEDKVTVRVESIFKKLAIEENVLIVIIKKTKTSFFYSARLDKLKKENETIAENNKWFDIRYEEEYNLKRKTASLFALLDYLEKNHLIYLFELFKEIKEIDAILPKGEFLPLELNGDLHIKDKENKIELLYGEGFEYFFTKIDYAIFPSNELIEFVKNEFKDKEQLRHDENQELQKDALARAEESTKEASKLGKTSIKIAYLSFFAAIMALVPESCRQQWFGIKDKNGPVKEQIYVINNGVIPDSIKKVMDKKAISNVKSSVKPDTIKK